MSFGRRIKAIRKANDLTQEEVARRAGMSLKGVSDIERGVIPDPHLSSLTKIATRGLGVDVSEILSEQVVEMKGFARPQDRGPTREEILKALGKIPELDEETSERVADVLIETFS